MAKISGLLIVSLVACVACAPPDRASAGGERLEAPALSPAPSSETIDEATPRIVFLGDSLTAGYGLDPDQSVPALIQAHLRDKGFDYRVVNAGVSGDTSAGGLNRLAWSLDGPVEILVIELGANDGLRGLPVASLKSNLTQIITTARQRGIKVVLTGMEAPPNFGAAYTSEFRNVYRQLAREHEVTFVPFYLAGVAGSPSLNLADGMHPNPEGSRLIEKTIWAALEPLLTRTGTRATSATR